MKIVILDAYTVNPGDIDWEPINKLGEVVVYDRTPKDFVVERCKGADIVLTNKVILDAEILNQLPRLLYIGVLATGYNVVDIEAANRQNIVVTNIPAYSTDSVAQMTFAHILNIFNRVDMYANMNRQGKWQQSPDFTYYTHNYHELAGKTMGIIGLGNTGMATAKIALAFGLKVIAVTSKEKEKLPEGIKSVDMDELFENADIISLHCPLNEQTKHLVNKERLGKVKKYVVIINTGRGPLVNDMDLAQSLNDNPEMAYGADVITLEPPVEDNPLMHAKNAFFTPHIAWATVEARIRLVNIAAENVKAFIKGKPINVVNP